MPGLRIVRSNAVFEALVPTVLAQKVTGLGGGTGVEGLVRAFGEPAPRTSRPEWAGGGPATVGSK